MPKLLKYLQSPSGVFFLFLAIYTVLTASSVGPVMRESDQAAFLHGALRLASGDVSWLQLDCYNSGVQFGTYWFIGGLFRLFGFCANEVHPDTLVLAGNWLAWGLLMAGVWFLAFRKCPQSWLEFLIWFVCLSVPTFLFSAPFLSSNVLSVGALCIFVSLFDSENKKPWFYAILAFLAFSAVALRGDAVLVMPWLAVLLAKKWSWKGFLCDRRLWFAGGGAVLALLTGKIVSTEPSSLYSYFFVLPSYAGFVLFGASASMFLLIFLITRVRIKRGWGILALASALLPLLFYSRVLYSPRHLLTTVLIVLFSIHFARGREWWHSLAKTLWGKIGLGVVAVWILGQLFIGFGFKTLKSPRLVLASPTLFPTSDGYWPMGCNINFLRTLGRAHQHPLDHNQRLWRLWRSPEKLQLPEGELNFRSSSITSYASLGFYLKGREQNENEGTILTDGRSLIKHLVIPSRVRNEIEIASSELLKKVKVLTSTSEEELYILGKGQSSPEELQGWEIRNILKKIDGENDYIVGKSTGAFWENIISSPGPHRWYIFIPSQKGGDLFAKYFENRYINNKLHGIFAGWEVREWVGNDKVLQVSDLSTEIWLARSALPTFFSAENY